MPREKASCGLLISGSEVRALHGSPLFSMTCGRLKSLPFFFCDQLVTIFSTTLLSILGQDSDRPTLSLIGCVDVSHGRHNRSVPHQLFDLHNVNDSSCGPRVLRPYTSVCGS